MMRLNKISASARKKGWVVGSFRMCKHPSKVSLVLSVHRKNSTLKLKRAPTPKEGNRQNVLARFDKIS
ncbi:hypothetical protein, partial [uncultured Rikenella sp.]